MFTIYFLTNLLVILTYFSTNANNSCSKNNIEECRVNTDNKYSKDINEKFGKYLDLIKHAQENYTPCNNTECNCHASVIKNDLKKFKQNGISQKQIQDVSNKGTKYQIINHKLYRDKSCMFPARCAGIEHFLLDLLPKLPDMEFIVNTRDWPQIHQNSIFGPVFSFSKTKHYNDIMYPAWAFWEGGPAISLYPTGIGKWNTHRIKLGTLGNETNWSEKLPKAFFRGSRTSDERDALVLLSREKPGLVDAQYTKNQAWKSDADTLYAPPAAEVSFEDHCKYKYLFNFRGVAASFRFKHILLCKSLVFHVGSDWLEFFYPALKPWVHYIPVEATANKEQLKELIEFAVYHDDLAKEIAEAGYEMIWNNLKMEDVVCYWKKLLKQYAKLLSYKPELDKSLMEINKRN